MGKIQKVINTEAPLPPETVQGNSSESIISKPATEVKKDTLISLKKKKELSNWQVFTQYFWKAVEWIKIHLLFCFFNDGEVDEKQFKKMDAFKTLYFNLDLVDGNIEVFKKEFTKLPVAIQNKIKNAMIKIYKKEFPKETEDVYNEWVKNKLENDPLDYQPIKDDIRVIGQALVKVSDDMNPHFRSK